MWPNPRETPDFWSHLLTKPLMENFIFLCIVFLTITLLAMFQWRNWGGVLCTIAPPLRKNLPFFKKHKDNINLLAYPNLKKNAITCSFCVPGFRKILLQVHLGKNYHTKCYKKNLNEPFDEKICYHKLLWSITMWIKIVWFRCVWLAVFLHFRKFF